MLFALLYALLRRVIGSGRPSADRELEIEVVVLRHQVKVLSRKVGQPKVFDLALPLEEVAEGFRAMDERRAIKALLWP